MKTFETGQLVHIPAGSYRMKIQETDQLKIPFTANIMTKPLVGIFKEIVDHTTCVVVFHDGEWIVERACIYAKNEGEQDAGAGKYNETRRSLATVEGCG